MNSRVLVTGAAGIKHFPFASSSSVYGNSTKPPFSADAKTDEPISLYAATKKADELLAYSYSHLYGMPTTGIRFLLYMVLMDVRIWLTFLLQRKY